MQRQVSLLNIMVELKKCANHPFLFESAEPENREEAQVRHPSHPPHLFALLLASFTSTLSSIPPLHITSDPSVAPRFSARLLRISAFIIRVSYR